ncbi:tetratricopeptide repeat protein [Aliiglaciecola sp. CAU 1673]|uniref:YfgM family protein n=1 Tax=Aliiglaciecola sp. CAU 1673 TaxID=3032595 RepID=UPI0023D97A58|nr:tetratricopeptide repeat protein [Aliiglaciecola sp. CAU 1673]MDF2178936.1 tetratricopeptide repeat protein [Aliiglaciecola sp. CAU 1673]
MEIYNTEEQQVEAIKKFWKDNGMAIVVGAVLGLGGLWGWRYYNETKFAGQEQASAQYEQAISSLEAGNDLSKVSEFIQTHSDNSYAVLAALQAAQKAVDADNLTEAADKLRWAAEHAEVDAVAAVANLRLARIQIQQAEYDNALSTLDKVSGDAFVAQVQEFKGDVYRLQGHVDKARAAYSAALEKNSGNNLLKMKLDNLSAAATAGA